jgi:Arm DNA-binding domain
MLTEEGIGGIEVPPGKKQLKVFDARGLYLLVERKAKAWRFRWQRARKERLMSLGTWPKVPLAEARQKAQALRQQLAKGQDPRILRKV